MLLACIEIAPQLHNVYMFFSLVREAPPVLKSAGLDA